MKSSTDLKSAKRLEEAAVRDALACVYKRHGVAAPKELSQDLASFVKKLRQGIHDTSSPLCQDLCLALFCGGEILPALRLAIQPLPLASSIEELLTTLRRQAKKRVSPKLFDRFRFACSAFLSSKVGHLIFGKIWPFDPRCFARNIGGRFMVEKVSCEESRAFSISWLVGATPTVGDHLSKEAVLAIRALKDPRSVFSYGLWIYCNLQGTKLVSEQKRSHELLKASRENIDHFRVASLSVDNPWYLGKTGTLLQHRRFVEHEINAAIEGGTSWFAFALKEEERQVWRDCTQFIVERAFLMAQRSHQDSAPIFHELVILGLIRAWQGFCLKNAQKDVLSTIACKECADRGGNANAALAWALLEGKEEDRIKNVEAILWGRPLLSRSRLNEHCRTKGFLSLVQTFPRQVVRDYLDAVYRYAQGNVPLSYVLSVTSSL